MRLRNRGSPCSLQRRVDFSEVCWPYPPIKDRDPKRNQPRKQAQNQFLEGQKCSQHSQNRNKEKMDNAEAQDLWVLRGGKAREGDTRMMNLGEYKISSGVTGNTNQ